MRDDRGKLLQSVDLSFELRAAAFGASTLDVEQAEGDTKGGSAGGRGGECPQQLDLCGPVGIQ